MNSDWGQNLIATADNIKQAIAVISNFVPNVILMSLTLTDSKGFDTFQIFHQFFPNLPTIVLIDKNERSLALTAISMGAQDYIEKESLTKDHLEKTISYAIESKHLSLEHTKSQEKLQFYSTILERINDIVMVIDQFVAVEHINSQGIKLLGHPPQELMDENWWHLVFATPEIGNKAKKQLLESKIGQESYDVALYTKSNEKLYFSVRKTNESNRSKVLVFRDITQRKKAELKLENKQTELETLLYRISHDLQAPISTFKGILNAFKSNTAGNKNELIDLLDQNLNRQHTLLSSFQEITLLYQRTVINSWNDVNLLPTFIENLLEHNYVFKADNVKWQLVKESGMAWVDIDLIAQILTYLIENALLYQKPYEFKPIKVIINKDETQLTIHVIDKGIGIPEPVRLKVFNLFYKNQEHSKGPGFGLFLANMAAQKMNGSLRFFSEVGVGTEMILKIPLKSHSSFPGINSPKLQENKTH